jgi:hypothetical protein
MPSIAKIDLAALQAREEQTIREMKKKDAQKGKGVSKDAQELFDAISRTWVFTACSNLHGLTQCLAYQPAGQTPKSSSTTPSSFSLLTPSTASELQRTRHRAKLTFVRS